MVVLGMDGSIAASARAIAELLFYGGGMLVLLGILVAVIFWFRKKMHHTGDNTVASPFTLDGLKEMLASGQISQQECETLGQSVLDKGINDTEKSISMSSNPYNVDDDKHKRGGDTRRPDDKE